MQEPAIALFARAPVIGQVKTRLIGSLSPAAACGLHRALAQDAWDVLTAIPGNKVFLYSDQEHPEWRELAAGRLRLQRGADLGERMLKCFDELRDGGHGPLLIVGSDTAALTPEIVAPWSEKLRAAGAVLGPAEDGGYWAIGCRSPNRKMFDGVEWSSNRTGSQTAEALTSCGMAMSFLESRYDVDTLADLARLKADQRVGAHVRAWLETQKEVSGC